MELEFYKLKFHAFFFIFSLIGHNSILNQASFSLKLDFNKIEFRNRSTDLYNFKTGSYCQIFLKNRGKRLESPIYMMMMFVFHLYLTCVVSFLSLYVCFSISITCLYFTLDALRDIF